MQAPILHILIDEDDIPRTINKRVKVNMIAVKHTYGVTVDEIAEHYGITVGDVYSALAYYHDNRAYFEQRDAETDPLLEEAKKYSAELHAKVKARMEQKQAED